MSTQSERAAQYSYKIRECIGWKLTGFSLEDSVGFKLIKIGFKNESTRQIRNFSMLWMEPEVDFEESK